MSSRLVTKCKLELFKEKLKTSKIYLEGIELFFIVGASLAYKTNSGFFFLHFTKKYLEMERTESKSTIQDLR